MNAAGLCDDERGRPECKVKDNRIEHGGVRMTAVWLKWLMVPRCYGEDEGGLS
jgi:hypothetical protein